MVIIYEYKIIIIYVTQITHLKIFASRKVLPGEIAPYKYATEILYIYILDI